MSSNLVQIVVTLNADRTHQSDDTQPHIHMSTLGEALRNAVVMAYCDPCDVGILYPGAGISLARTEHQYILAWVRVWIHVRNYLSCTQRD
jgi:hypothetical protein